jgi:hypothetical protein
MIERLKQSGGHVFGFKVMGKLTAADVRDFEPVLDFAIGERKKKPIAILADLSEMDGVDWKARVEEIRFLAKHKDQVARVAVVGAHAWEQIAAQALSATVLVEAETRYFQVAEIVHAWSWVKTGKHPGEVPVRQVFTGPALMAGYNPEYLDV